MSLYNKYRPQSFEEMVGNEDQIKVLQKFISDKNRPHVYLFTGSSGCGKCVDGNTIIFTKEGLKRISDFSINKEGFQKKKIFVQTINDIECTSHFYEEHVKETIEIYPQIGASIRGTINHPLLTFSNGRFIYKAIKDIKNEDVLVGQIDYPQYGIDDIKYNSLEFVRNRHDTHPDPYINFPKELNEDLSYLLGCIIGNGCMSGFNIRISTHNEQLVKEIKRISDKFKFPIDYDFINHWITFNKRRVAHFFNFIFDGELKTARYKVIPKCIVSSSKEMQIAFLKGLFDCDAYLYTKSNIIEYSTASCILKNDVLVLLNNIGILAYSREKYNNKYNHVYWEIFISGNDFYKWSSLCGDTIKYKFSLLEKKKTNTNIKVYPGIKDIILRVRDSVRKELNVDRSGRYNNRLVFPSLNINNGEFSLETLKNSYSWLLLIKKIAPENKELINAFYILSFIIDNDLFFSKINNIKKIKDSSIVYDITLPLNHNFIANGFINHNTTAARIMAKEIGAGDLSIREVNSSNNRGIDTAREITDQMRYGSMDGKPLVWIMDECFQKDTMIKTIDSEKHISDIKINDYVYNALGISKVKNIFINKVDINRLYKVKINGKYIYTTCDHLFFTQYGWLKAKDLRMGDLLFIIDSSIMNTRGIKDYETTKEISKSMRRMWKQFSIYFGSGNVLLKALQDKSKQSRKREKSNNSYLLGMWGRIQKIWERLLLFKSMFNEKQDETARISGEGIHERICRKTINKIKTVYNRSSRICKSFIGEDEEKQSLEKSRSSKEDEGNKNKKWYIRCFEISSWREWAYNKRTEIIERFYLWGIGICNFFRWQKERISYLLQGRYRDSVGKISHRNRWERTFESETDSKRQEKRELLNTVRVEDIEIFQRGNYERSSWGCLTSEEIERGFTEYYDLEIEGHPSYFANDVLVHNCHKWTSDMSNAMLKPLEDTPFNIYFFLCTTDPQKLLTALKNRCTEIKFNSLKPEQLLLLLRKVNKKEGTRVSLEVLEAISEKVEGSPRAALVLLEKVIGIETEKEQSQIIENDAGEDVSKETIDFCRILLSSKNWYEVAEVLKTVPMDEPERVRYAVLGYMNAVLLKGKQNDRAGLAMEFFSENTFCTGKAGITLAAYQTLFAGK